MALRLNLPVAQVFNLCLHRRDACATRLFRVLLAPGAQERLACQVPQKDICGWGGHPWPPITLAGAEARPNKFFLILSEPTAHEQLS